MMCLGVIYLRPIDRFFGLEYHIEGFQGVYRESLVLFLLVCYDLGALLGELFCCLLVCYILVVKLLHDMLVFKGIQEGGEHGVKFGVKC